MTVGPILLHVHAKEAHIHTVNLLKDEQGLRTVQELLRELSLVALPHQTPCLQHFIRGGHHADSHLTSIRVT